MLFSEPRDPISLNAPAALIVELGTYISPGKVIALATAENRGSLLRRFHDFRYRTTLCHRYNRAGF